MQRVRQHFLKLAFLVCGHLTAAGAIAATLDEQRAAFREVYAAAERGDWGPARARTGYLEDYELWPDLRSAYLRARLRKNDDRSVAEFLDKYGTLKPARELRYRYALTLAKERRYEEFLAIYEAFYAGLDEATLDCLAAHANIRLGRLDRVTSQAERLWLVGTNQVEECDPVFSYMRGAGRLTPDLLRRRFALAIDQRQFLLARYLARSIDDEHQAIADRWLKAQGDPERFLRTADAQSSDAVYHEQLAYAARRLAFSEPRQALTHWSRLGRSIDFDAELDYAVTRQAALWAARRNLTDARDLLDRLVDPAVDNEVRRWQIRSALRENDWASVVEVIDALEPREHQRQEWRYWRGIALERAGAEAEGMLVLSGLAREQSYYGFLAADQLAIDYAFSETAATADEVTIARLAAMPDLVRARELFRVGLDGRARSEWDAAMRTLGDDEKTQAATVAHRWGWHSRAISAAAKAGQFDDLGLHYPLPHREAFRRSSNETGIRESWAYGVARSESLFMRDVRSSAGAVGVMQLMPSTGRSTAREIRYPYRGRETLIDPASNIHLGTTYLSQMHNRFDQHTALATAAYNAGPGRVEQWLPGAGPMDARIWIETIPYNETRSYVRRVLSSDVIFHWRLTGRIQRLSDHLKAVMPPPRSARALSQ